MIDRFPSLACLFAALLLGVSSCSTTKTTEKAERVEEETLFVAKGETRSGEQFEFVQRPFVLMSTKTSSVEKLPNSVTNCELYAGFQGGAPEWINYCNAALDLDDLSNHNRAATNFNRGLIYKKMGFYDLARQDFMKAKALLPSLGRADLELAVLSYYESDYETAVALAESTLNDPDVPKPINYHLLGRVYEALFEFDKAHLAYDAAQAEGLNSRMLRNDKARMNRLWPNPKN